MDTKLIASLEASKIRFVRVVFCDNANVIRGKAIHINVLGDYLAHGVGITAAQQALPVMFDAVAPDSGLGPVGEIRLMPDWPTLVHLPYAPGHARVLGNFVKDGRPWDLCPRHFLKRMMADAAKEGLEIQAGFENEFFLLRDTPEGPVPTDDSVFAATQGMDRGRVVIDAIVDALVAQGITVELYHPESGPGQHEISTRHGPVDVSADRQLIVRETVRAVADQHGLKASFLPKILADKAGSGCHVHLSLWRNHRNLVPDDPGNWGLSATARAFIAGMLDHLPALMAITTPSTNSYRRIHPHFWSGAYRAWGLDNREAAIRVPTSPTGAGPTNFELKTIDASANPHLALGAVIAAGLDGVRRRLDLPQPVQVDPGCLTEDERKAKAIDALPTRLSESLANLRRDQVLLTALGPALAQAFLAVRQMEWDAMQDLELVDEIKLLLERY